MLCPKCGSPANSSETVSFCPVCNFPLLSAKNQKQPTAAASEGIPWEQVQSRGVTRAVLETLHESILKPGIFFQRVALSRNSFMAILYGLVIGSVGSLFNFLWTYFLITPLLAFIPWLEQYTGSNTASITGLMFTPIIVFLKIALTALYFHTLLFITRSNAQNSRATLRIVCYAQSAAILSCIPLAGSVIAPLWELYLMAIGFHKVHKISITRAVVIILLPLIVVGVGLILLIAGIFGAGMLFQDTFKDLLNLIRY